MQNANKAWLYKAHIPTGTMSWYWALLTVLNVLDGLGKTGGPEWRESSPTWKNETKKQMEVIILRYKTDLIVLKTAAMGKQLLVGEKWGKEVEYFPILKNKILSEATVWTSREASIGTDGSFPSKRK